MQRCPHCRARRKDRSICPRCGTDLHLLLVIESQAESLARQAVQSLSVHNIPVAEQQAATAVDLHATIFHRALNGFIGTLAEEPGLQSHESPQA